MDEFVKKIERYRRKLIDVSKKNPLFSFKFSDRSRTHIRIVDEIPDFVLDKLKQDKELTFAYVKSPNDIPLSELTDEFYELLEKEKQSNKKYLEIVESPKSTNKEKVLAEYDIINKVRFDLRYKRIIFDENITVEEQAKRLNINTTFNLPYIYPDKIVPKKFLDNTLQTLMFRDNLNDRLHTIFNKVSNILKETGVGSLYLIYGNLKWYENNDYESPILTPILIQEVDIVRYLKNGEFVYTIKAIEESPELNIVLQQKLKDLNFHLENYDENGVDDYFKYLKKKINEKYPQWEILNYLTVGIVSSTNLILYEDLDVTKLDLNIDDSQMDLLKNVLGFGNFEDEDIENINHDNLLGTDKLPLLVTEADGSQFSAIHAVLNKSQNVIIQGPPGTGKSQTICNLISSAINKNKSVLFLAEKLAALNVVKNRLDNMSIGNFCLEIHSNKIKKNEIIDSIRNRFVLKKERKLGETISMFNLEEHIELVKKLNIYSELTNTYNKIFKKNYFDLTWQFLKLSDELSYNSKNEYKTKIKTKNFKSIEDINLIVESLKQYKILKSKFHKKYGSENDNHWKNFYINKNKQKSEDEIIRIIRDFLYEATSLKQHILDLGLYDLTINQLQINADRQIVTEILEIEKTIPQFKVLLKLSNITEDLQILRKLIIACKQLDQTLSDLIPKEIYKSDYFSSTLLNIESSCENLEITSVNPKKLKKFIVTIDAYIENRLQEISVNEITEAEKFINADLKDSKYFNVIETLIKLTKEEKYLRSNFLKDESSLNYLQWSTEVDNKISKSRYKSLNVIDLNDKIRQLRTSIEIAEKLQNLLIKLYNPIISEKKDFSIQDLEDLSNINTLLQSYQINFQFFWSAKIFYSDLTAINLLKNKITGIQQIYNELSTKLNFASLASQDLIILKSYIKEFKESGFLKIFKKSYWKLKSLKPFLEIEKLDIRNFIQLIDRFINTKEIEEQIKKEDLFVRVFCDYSNLFEINFDLLIDTIHYREALKSYRAINKENEDFIIFILESNENTITDIKNKMEVISLNNDKFIEDYSAFNCVTVKSLQEIYTEENNTLLTLVSLVENIPFNGKIIVADLLEFNSKIRQLNSLTILYKDGQSESKLFFDTLNILLESATKITLTDKFNISEILTIKKNLYQLTESEKVLSNNNLRSYFPIDFAELDYLLSTVSSLHKLILELTTNHLPLIEYLKKDDVNLVEVKNHTEEVYKRLIELLSIIENLHEEKVINITKQFESILLSQIKFKTILDFFNYLLNDIEGYSEFVKYHSILSTINFYELNNFLLDIKRNDFKEDEIDKYFLLFIISTSIDDFWKENRYRINNNLNDSTLENSYTQFRQEDKQQLIVNRSSLTKKLLSRTLLDMKHKYYRNEKNRKASDKVGFDLLYNELSKQTRHIPIRTLFQKAGEEVLFYKPCLMMSPQSVSQFLPKKDFLFDIIIIDEASQVKPEKCLGSLLRGKQLVVVGDSKQLPPTFDYRKSLDDEEIINDDNTIQEEDEQIEESILELANGTIKNNYMLTWHYRSKHHSLINFSNSKFYDDKLLIFPSPNLNSDFGISHYYLKDAVYNDGLNHAEAESIVNQVIELLSSDSNDTIGVVAVNQKQSNLIDDLIFKRISSSPLKDQLYKKATEGEEQLIIKNLENIQGDERDIILISTVYGKDNTGKFYQRFGPINSKYGHRRLNVLFTRARKKILLYTSMIPEEIVTENKNLGVKILKEYLEYSQSGVLQIAEDTNKDVDSDFEVSVKQFLESNGFEVNTQIGVKGYFIDLAVKDKSSSRYILGIECDGAPYHIELSARERDRLRQEVLEGLGWNIYRILSTNWYSNYENEKEKLLKRINELICNDSQ